MKNTKLKPLTQQQQKQVAGGHIGDGSGPIWKKPDGTVLK